MADFFNDDLEYDVDGYYDTADFVVGDTEIQRNSSLDSDFEDDFEQSKQKSDTSALEARNGKDIQGIPWERLNSSRAKYHETRLKHYKNYESLSRSHSELDKECLQVEKGKTFYDFQFNTRIVKSTIVHFQLETLHRFFAVLSENKIINELRFRIFSEEAVYLFAKARQIPVGLVLIGTISALFKVISLHQ